MANRINIQLPASAKRQIELLAEERAKEEGRKNTVTASDVVRDAIKFYFDHLGIPIDVEVDRGGDRVKRD